MTLQDKLDAFKAALEADQLPFKLAAQDHALMREAIQTQIASGMAERALKVGDAAPGFTLSDSENRPCSSTALLAKGPLVVSFYRGIWCPYCTLDLQALQAALPAITQYGAQLLAVSPQSAVHSRQAARDHDLTFPLLSDTGNRLAAQFGLRYRLPDALIALYQQRLGLDLAQFNQDDSWTLPLPARFVIARDGRIVYAEAHADYTQRPEPQALLSVLEMLA
ncbi:TPA: AhpC/TSA family protein [Serratia marcescens]|uniref:peroxiredoxin-like family protein n=1 Tax=Serratia TaxID=613 RepID=UPI000667E6BB|nr:peroxiredoxin-like family protein [Serratia marcescens]MBH2668469.1 AhpC/TSA family protein [Serratia marcescens]MBH2673134.1 AhpC/TSA family protein [Serratia marcescens]MBH3055266.1 AhpC/TSA family protein [Serratia marcescens]MBH3203778.1 AhpC/TSA family protein [Serratia marcescens]MDP8798759.1 peroxiredoxin-like family protein [Serratia marcescens]